MRRLPVYFLVDVSESMVGEPIQQVENGMRQIVQELRTDPYALETAFISVIAFAGKAKSLSPLTELYKFYPPTFPIGGGTSLGAALDFLMDDIDRNVVKTTQERKGDWKPIIFLFTDGTPTDNPSAAFARWNNKYRRKANIVAISIGNNVNTQLLGQISDNVLRLNNTDEMSFKAFFKWVTASIQATSVSVTDMGDDSVALAPTTGINLEKVDTSKPCVVDENFTVLLGKCSNTKNTYLVKYAKHLSYIEGLESIDMKATDFKLVGAYPVDEETYNSLSDGKSNHHINTMSLRGVPTCPCCGAQLGVVVCECGNIMCSDGQTTACPWCGMEGSLGEIAEGGMDITRGRGQSIMTLEKALQIFIGNQEDKKAESFLKFLSDKLWDQYKEHIMDKIKMVNGELKWNLNIPNAKENIEYNQTVSMPTINSDLFSNVELELVDVKGLTKEEHGVKLSVAPDGKSFAITGTPSLEAFRKNGAVAESTFELTLCYKFIGDIEMSEDCPTLEHKIPFVINQDPRKLWKNLPVDWDNMPEPKYKNDDTQVEYVKVEALTDGTPQKDIVAASKRGRSHAQEGKPRDDHFRMEHMDNGWYIMAVADGAGSAKFSRQGSKIACDESVSYCMSKLGQSKTFEEAISNYGNLQNVSEEEARKIVGNYIYEIVGTAAFKAHKAIQAESALTKQPIKYYATTLLLTICKKFSFGWFVASFWVGDGAICLYDRKAHTAKILGVPDEGEYAGQTRFLTMSEIFKDATALYQRLRFCIVNDFTALFLMSDGVSDPKFETDANLNNPDKWDALWDDLKENGVDLTDDNEASKDQLLDWLDFWAPGNHDDRTIAILYEGEDDNLTEKNTTEDQTSEQEPEEQQNE